MGSKALDTFSFCYKQITVDEVALEGLDGITIELLWKYIEKRLSRPLNKKVKDRIWNFILSCKDITFYNLPEPKVNYELIDRYSLVNETSGTLIDPTDYLDGPYVYSPIENENGSCEHYNTRVNISKDADQVLTYEKAIETFGNRFVLVASEEARWNALAPHSPIHLAKTLIPQQYCLLELVGKGRHNGQATCGKSNIVKIFSDPKLLFYYRKFIQDNEIIKATSVSLVNGQKYIVLKLKRFHRPKFDNIPSSGPIPDVVNYLKSKPGVTATQVELINNKIVDQAYAKRLRKFVSIFKTEVLQRENFAGCKAYGVKAPKIVRTIQLLVESDNEEEDEDKKIYFEEGPKSCYKVGISLARQAYQLFLKAGSKGLTMKDINYLLGVDVYTSRHLCKLLSAKYLIRQFYEEKGRQKRIRFTAVVANAPNVKAFKDESGMLEEMLKLRQFKESLVKDNLTISNDITGQKRKLDDPSDPDEAPLKKPNNSTDEDPLSEMLNNISEEKCTATESFENLMNMKKLTMRQLKLANAIIKVTRDNEAITTYFQLSKLATEEANVLPMDRKSFKKIVNMLYLDGHLKIWSMRWPGRDNDVPIICAPHITIDHPIMRKKYEQTFLVTHIVMNKPKSIPKPVARSTTEKLPIYSYQKYMRAQKLHSFLFKCCYGPDRVETGRPEGFGVLLEMIPHMTVELALGHVTWVSAAYIQKLNVTKELASKKLNECPSEVYKTIIQIRNLQGGLKNNLTLLAAMGLVQLCSHQKMLLEPNNLLSAHVFYVNRKATIVDTTGVWPREEANQQEVETSFHFNTTEDVAVFWNSVQHISLGTKIKFVNVKPQRVVYPTVPVRYQDEVYKHDTGVRIGDGNGPCGYDSCFYTMFVHRYWKSQTLFYDALNIRNTVAKPVNNIIPRKDKSGSRKKRVKKQQKPPPKRVYFEKVKNMKTRSKTVFPIKYSVEDDDLFMMCDVVVSIMSPAMQPGCLQIKNDIAACALRTKHPEITVTMVHKRFLSLVLMNKHTKYMQKKDSLLLEMKRRPHLTEKYDGLLRKLRQKYMFNMRKYLAESKTPAFELLWIVYQVYHSESYNIQRPCIAGTIEDFHKKYNVLPVTIEKSIKLYRMQPTDDIVTETAKESIMMAMNHMHSLKYDVETAKKAYLFLSQYEEPNLRKALEKLRRATTVVTKDKTLWSHFSKYTIQDLLTSLSYNTAVASFRLAKLYLKRFEGKLNTEFSDNVANALKNEIPETPNGNPELNCVILEAMSTGAVQLKVVTPVSMSMKNVKEEYNDIDIDYAKKFKVGTTGCKMNTNSRIIQFSTVDYEDAYRKFERSAIVEKVEDVDIDSDCVLKILDESRENGSTFETLIAISGMGFVELHEKLFQFEDKSIVKRVGYEDNRIVLTKYTDPWTVEIQGVRIIPYSWMSVDLCQDKSRLFKWCGALLNKIFECPGINISDLSDAFLFTPARYIHEICLFLQTMECVKITMCQEEECDFYSDDETQPNILDLCLYPPLKQLMLIPTKDCLSKYCYARYMILSGSSQYTDLYISKK